MCYNAFDMSASKKRILLVEDDNFLNQLYTDLLKKEGYEVTSVIDGETALEKIRTNSWDLILLDVVLPGKSGFEVFAEVTKKSKPISFLNLFIISIRTEGVSGFIIIKLLSNDFIIKWRHCPKIETLI